MYHSLWTYRNMNNRSNPKYTGNIQKIVKEKGAFYVKVTQWWSNGTQNSIFSLRKNTFKGHTLKPCRNWWISLFTLHNTQNFSLLKPSRNPTAIAGISFQHTTSFCHRHWLVTIFSNSNWDWHTATPALVLLGYGQAFFKP